CGGRQRDKNRLEKTDDAGAGPDHGGNDEDENNDETGSQRRPHHLALPQRGIFLHFWGLSANLECRAGAAVTLDLGVAFDVGVRYFISVRSLSRISVRR